MKPRSQILSAIALVPIALITLPEHWGTFAKVAGWYFALHALIWLITKIIVARKDRMFERIEKIERERRRVAACQVTPDEWEQSLAAMTDDDYCKFQTRSHAKIMKN